MINGKERDAGMELNRKNMKKILWLIAFAVILYSLLEHLPKVWGVFKMVCSVLAPFFIGCAIAFVLNVPMRFIEKIGKKLLCSRKRFRFPPKMKRPVSLALTLLFVAAVISFVIFLLVPELKNTFGMLRDTVPVFIRDLQSWALQFSDDFPQISQWILNLSPDWEKITGFLGNSASNVINSTVTALSSVVSGTIHFLIGLIFACYLLLQKERLLAQFKRFAYAFFPERGVTAVLAFGAMVNRIFSNFIAGQCTEAVILGGLCFVGMSILQFPYALMISVLVGVMSLIPIFGALVAVVIGTFLILMVSPVKALLFVVFFAILQQVEGNLIYPRVVGNSIGLPAIWVLASVILGSTFGIFGILLFIPLCSLVYTLLKQAVELKEEQKKTQEQR